MRSLLLAALVASLCSCSGTAEKEGRIPLDAEAEGGVVADLSKAPGLKEVFAQPRRYPYTVAVVPLFIEFSDAENVYEVDLDSPLPFVPPSEVRSRHPHTTQWAHLRDRDSRDEELAILKVMRDGAGATAAKSGASALKNGAAPANGKAPEDGKTPEDGKAPEKPAEDGKAPEKPAEDGKAPEKPAEDGQAPPPADTPKTREPREVGRSKTGRSPALARLLRRAPIGFHCPPGPEGEAAEAAAVSTFTYAAPDTWENVSGAVEVGGGTLISAHRAPDGQGTVYAVWEPRETYVAKGSFLAQDDAFLQAFEAKRLAATRTIEHVTSRSWTEVRGHPAIAIRADLGGDFEASLWFVFLKDRVFTISVILRPSERKQADQILGSVQLSGPKVEAQPMADEPRKRSREMTTTERAKGKEADALDGKNFAINDVGFQERMSALLEQFGTFENVIKLKVSDQQKRDLDGVLAQADARGADLVLIGRLKRNKVSYTGISGAGPFVVDFLGWLTLWFPHLWPGVKSENYRADVELVLEVYDSRSKKRLWSFPYRNSTTLSLSALERGWIPWGVLLIRLGLLTDGMLVNAGTKVRPRTWMDVEHQILYDLWSERAFKGELDQKNFTDRINTNVEPRRTGLIVGVSRYGPQAAPVLTDLAAAAFEKGTSSAQQKELEKKYTGKGLDLRGMLLEELQQTYDEPTLGFGVRPYAESDAQALRQFLVNDAQFNRGDVRTLTGAQVGRIALKAELRRIAKARRPDPVFVYLNLETAVVDDPSQPGDELRKYLLPYDVDLVTLERLRTASEGDLAALVAELKLVEEGQPCATRPAALRAWLERTAISFDWIEATFNQSSLDDHRHLQSQEVMLVIDCAFPGQTTGLRYAPIHASKIEGGWVPSRGGVAAVGPGKKTPGAEKKTPGEKTPGEKTPGEEKTPVDKPPVDKPPVEKKPGDGIQPRQPRWVPEAPGERKKRWIGKRRRAVAPTTVFAQDKKDVPEPKKDGPKEKAKGQGKLRAPQLTDQFIRRISRVPGRLIVLTGRFNEALLDVIPQKRGGFAYHFLKGATDRKRVPERMIGLGSDRRRVVDSRSLIDYARGRIEDESRTLNSPQSVIVFGDNDDFPVIERK